MNKKIITTISIISILSPLYLQGSMVEQVDIVAKYYKDVVDTTNDILTKTTKEVKDSIQSSLKKYTSNLKTEYPDLDIDKNSSFINLLNGPAKQANNDIDLLFKTANDPLKKKYAELTRQLKKQLTKLDSLLNPMAANLSGGKTLKSAIEDLISNAEKQATHLAERACNGNIKNGLVDPAMFNTNPVSVFKTFVPRKNINKTESYTNTIDMKLRLLFLPYTSNTEDATKDFPKVERSLLFPLNKTFVTCLINAEKKKRTADANSLFGKQSHASLKKTNDLIKEAKDPYTASIKKLKSDITCQINTYYNNLVDQINECLAIINDLLNPSLKNSLKKTIASALFDTSVGPLSRDAFNKTASDTIKKYTTDIEKIQIKFDTTSLSNYDQVKMNADNALRIKEQDDAIKKEKDDKIRADYNAAQAKLLAEKEKRNAERQAQYEIDNENGLSTGNESTDYNSNGYEPDGYEPDGYEPDGYEPDSYESDGYESDGYDSNDTYQKPISQRPQAPRDAYGLEEGETEIF